MEEYISRLFGEQVMDMPLNANSGESATPPFESEQQK
jgi:hypothetical protein